MNPIPSRGFYTEGTAPFILPEAMISRDGDHLIIEMNERVMPKVSLNKDYCTLLNNPECQDAQPYLKEKLTDAKNLLKHLQNRHDTIFRLLSAVAEIQKGYFLHGRELLPMNMRQLADRLNLNISTVSRTVKDKYIQFDGRVFPLRALFTAPLHSSDGQAVSAEAARQQIRRFIQAEDAKRPLSDGALGEALAGVGIVLSRRTVAKYRGELGIPAASVRKRSAMTAVS
jgi:RNA polymerase sigma-54 factor